MATTTPNFGWPVPTSTDLVKDGATAIESLGDSIDASLVDLKGGTTGQVLSKASNTDMDFTWAASSSSPLTTKGDLYTYSTTNARLAVGGDYGFLQANSAAATGNEWNSTQWTAFTPTVTAASGTITSATATGRYIRVGKLCVVQYLVDVTNNGTGSAAMLTSLPFNANSNTCIGSGREIYVTGNMCQIEGQTSTCAWRRYDNAYPAATGYGFRGTFTYEVA